MSPIQLEIGFVQCQFQICTHQCAYVSSNPTYNMLHATIRNDYMQRLRHSIHASTFPFCPLCILGSPILFWRRGIMVSLLAFDPFWLLFPENWMWQVPFEPCSWWHGLGGVEGAPAWQKIYIKVSGQTENWGWRCYICNSYNFMIHIIRHYLYLEFLKRVEKAYPFWMKIYPIRKAGGGGGVLRALTDKIDPGYLLNSRGPFDPKQRHLPK